MTKPKPKYFLVAPLGPDGEPYGKAVGHVEDYGPDVPRSDRYLAYYYRPAGDLPEVNKVGTCATKTEAFRMVREAHSYQVQMSSRPAFYH
jgi:hypothetical protein